MVDALLLIQDVQLLCFAIIFGFVSLQHPQDRTRRWLWFSFLANGVGALLDFGTPHLPPWLGRGVNMGMIPLSYVLINAACVHFLRRYRYTVWIGVVILAATIPFNLAWSARMNQVPNDSLVDLAIGLLTIVTGLVLLGSDEKATRWPRILMSAFFLAFAGVELFRALVAFVLHQNPDVYPAHLDIVSSVAYIVSTSVLPLAFLWMINSRVEADLVTQNMMDPLTHVLNRRGLNEALEKQVARYARSQEELTVAILDLDHFKQLNDTFGHAVGDAMLAGLATLLKELIRPTDTVARIGGEEFVLLLPSTQETSAMALLERLRIAISEYAHSVENGDAQVTASFGATSTGMGGSPNAAELMREADVALYRAKREGRDKVCFFDPEEDRDGMQRARVFTG